MSTIKLVVGAEAARLTPRLSRSFHLEAAYMLPAKGRAAPQEHCLFLDSKAASNFAQAYGVVVSWCTRSPQHENKLV